MNTIYSRRCGQRFLCIDDFVRTPRCGSALLNALIAHWGLDEASGERADVHGSHTLGDINEVGQAAGKLGNAASFIGASEQALGAADSPALSMGNIDFTIAGWVRFDALAAAGLIGKWSAGSLEYLVSFDGTNIRFQVSNNGSSATSVASGASISSNTWYFFVAWHDAASDTINLSVNNNTAASAAHTTGVHDGNSALYLGWNEDGLAFLTGRLDSISIWKRLLTAGERTQLYNAGNGLDYPFN